MDTTVQGNNRAVIFQGKPQRERAMPWNGDSIVKHNKSLKPGSKQAGAVAGQANAIMREGAPEGVALATAFKHLNKLRKSGRVSEKQGQRFAAKHGPSGEDVVASSR